MPYWLAGSYNSMRGGSIGKKISVLLGPYADSLQAESIALAKIVPLNGAEYNIFFSHSRNRDEARREYLHTRIAGDTPLDEALVRYNTAIREGG